MAVDGDAAVVHRLRRTASRVTVDRGNEFASQRAYHRRASPLRVRLWCLERYSSANECFKQQYHAFFKCARYDQHESRRPCPNGRISIRHFLDWSGEAWPIRNHCFLIVTGSICVEVELRTLRPQRGASLVESLRLRSQSAGARPAGDG